MRARTDRDPTKERAGDPGAGTSLDGLAAPYTDDGCQRKIARPVYALNHAGHADRGCSAERDGAGESRVRRIRSPDLGGDGRGHGEGGRRVAGRERNERAISVVETAAELERVLGLYTWKRAAGNALPDTCDDSREGNGFHAMNGEAAHAGEVTDFRSGECHADDERPVAAEECDVTRQMVNAAAARPVWFTEFARDCSIERGE